VEGRRHVIVEAAMFIEGNEEEGLLPLRGGSKGFVDIFVESFTEGNVLKNFW
jgi:hypothetical protein